MNADRHHRQSSFSVLWPTGKPGLLEQLFIISTFSVHLFEDSQVGAKTGVASTKEIDGQLILVQFWPLHNRKDLFTFMYVCLHVYICVYHVCAAYP